MEVFLTGQIQGGQGFSASSSCCKFQLVHGDSWTCLEGLEQGWTQVDQPSQDQPFVWSHPLDIHYSTSSLAGWPKLRVEVFKHDSLGRNSLCGYGFVIVPTAPGYHSLEIKTFLPTGNPIERAYAFFLGYASELEDKSVIEEPNDRYKLNTSSSGTVFAELSVILKNADKYGLSF